MNHVMLFEAESVYIMYAQCIIKEAEISNMTMLYNPAVIVIGNYLLDISAGFLNAKHMTLNP